MADDLQKSPALAADPLKAEERVSVASNWKLVWWRFRKNRLAVVSASSCSIFYVSSGPDFFSNQDPEATDAAHAFIPGAVDRLLSRRLDSSFGAGVVGKRNPVTLEMEWALDPDATHPSALRLPGTSTNAGPVPGQHPSARRQGTESRQLHSAGHRPTGARSVVAHDVRHAYIHDGRPGGGDAERDPWCFPGRDFGLFGGWIDHYPAGDRDTAVAAYDPDLAHDDRGAAARLGPEQVFFAITIILALIGWTTLAREVRGRFLSLREEDFVLAAELAGCSPCASSCDTWSRLPEPHHRLHHPGHPVMIISETSLSFLGLGIRPPAISWGVLLQEAQNIQTLALAPWLLIPGLVVIFAVLASTSSVTACATPPIPMASSVPSAAPLLSVRDLHVSFGA